MILFLQENLHKEISELQDQYSRHPDILKYRMESDNLKTELRRLKCVQQGPAITAEVTAQLEAEYKQLQLHAKQGKGWLKCSSTGSVL